MSTTASRSTSSGCRRARHIAILPPMECPTRATGSSPISAATRSASSRKSKVSVQGERPWLGMSSSSTRWPVLRALAACVQFLPWPKSPWQKTTRGPESPSSVRCRLTRPSSRSRVRWRPPTRSEVEAVEPVEHAADAVADAAEHVADALADRTDALTETVEAATEEHAHEHPVHRREGTEVALRVGLVGPAALPVGHPARADHDLADVGLGTGTHALDVERARRDLALRAARRGPRDVGDGHAVARVEEARGAALRQRLPRHPGAHARHRVAAVLEDLGDVLDLR